MTITLKQQRAIAGIGEVLYHFLPGSGNPRWKGHVSFRTVAAKVGVADFWSSGSKHPAICSLLERTLERESDHFRPLILEIVRAGIRYRQKQKTPITAEEIDLLNGHIKEVGFKFSELWDPEFRESLRHKPEERARQHVDEALRQEKLRASERNQHSDQLEQLKADFLALESQSDRQAAGLILERLLNSVFDLFDLKPRAPFRVTGEQIDGSFQLDHETYLLEAKWESDPLGEAPLLVFRGKIEGKSAITRGVFIALNGISEQARHTIATGKQPTFFVLDGYDLMMILSDGINLTEFLRQRVRLLAEEGLVCVPYIELYKGSRAR